MKLWDMSVLMHIWSITFLYLGDTCVSLEIKSLLFNISVLIVQRPLYDSVIGWKFIPVMH